MRTVDWADRWKTASPALGLIITSSVDSDVNETGRSGVSASEASWFRRSLTERGPEARIEQG
jgi:hypothetical protein